MFRQARTAWADQDDRRCLQWRDPLQQRTGHRMVNHPALADQIQVQWVQRLVLQVLHPQGVDLPPDPRLRMIGVGGTGEC